MSFVLVTLYCAPTPCGVLFVPATFKLCPVPVFAVPDMLAREVTTPVLCASTPPISNVKSFVGVAPNKEVPGILNYWLALYPEPALFNVTVYVPPDSSTLTVKPTPVLYALFTFVNVCVFTAVPVTL